MRTDTTRAASATFAANRARGAVKYACDRASLDPAEISRQMAL